MISQNEKIGGDTILLYPKSVNGVMEQNPSKKTELMSENRADMKLNFQLKKI